MTRFFSSIIVAIIVSMTSFTVTAAELTQLSVKSVKVLDSKNIRVTFSESMDTESVVLKIVKQSDNSTIKTDAVKAVSDTPEAVDVVLDDVLVEASSYTLTVIAAIGTSGSTITDGATALQDFITPSPLKIAADETLNAPSNPNAVMTEDTPTDVPTVTPTNTTTPPKKETKPVPVVPTPAPTEELPLTGPSSYLLFLLALPLAYLFIRKRAA